MIVDGLSSDLCEAFVNCNLKLGAGNLYETDISFSFFVELHQRANLDNQIIGILPNCSGAPVISQQSLLVYYSMSFKLFVISLKYLKSSKRLLAETSFQDCSPVYWFFKHFAKEVHWVRQISDLLSNNDSRVLIVSLSPITQEKQIRHRFGTNTKLNYKLILKP